MLHGGAGGSSGWLDMPDMEGTFKAEYAWAHMFVSHPAWMESHTIVMGKSDRLT